MINPQRFKIPRFYKTLLALTVVIGPITWLMVTEDGRRRTDLMVLGFKDAPMVQMRLDPLTSAFSEDRIREFLPEIQWQCSNTRTPFGERNCVSPIGAFNETPAHYMTLYFEGDALQAMKVAYRGAYHNHLTGLLAQMLGPPKNDQGIWRWVTEHGLVLVPANLTGDAAEPALMWLSADRVLQRADATGG